MACNMSRDCSVVAAVKATLDAASITATLKPILAIALSCGVREGGVREVWYTNDFFCLSYTRKNAPLSKSGDGCQFIHPWSDISLQLLQQDFTVPT